MNRSHGKRILSVDAFSRGFGFAVLEGPQRLIEWGVAEARSDKRIRSLRRIVDLLESYRPATLIMEDWAARGSRRRPRIRKLLQAISDVAQKKRIRGKRVTLQAVRKTFSPSAAFTKYQVATVVATRFPELSHHLPKPRKYSGEGEDPRIRLFGAVALALVYFDRQSGRKPAVQPPA